MDTGLPAHPVKFAATVSGGEPGVTPTFKWTVPHYAILSGQGTGVITVEPLLKGGTVTATVEVGGYDRSCEIKASCTTSVIADPMPRKVDECAAGNVKDERTQLDRFAAELRNDPTAQGYFICYGGRRSRVGEAQLLCRRALSRLVSARGIDATRVVTVDGGFREEPLVELWVVPSGVTPPPASPTVDPSEVSPPSTPRRARRGRGRR